MSTPRSATAACARSTTRNKRFTAPSYGFDLVTVLEHCLRSRNLTTWRDGSIVLALAAATYLNWVSAAALGAALVCLRVTGRRVGAGP
jgi:hypothetical protein